MEGKPLNRRLYDALNSYASEALQTIRSRYQSGGLPARMVHRAKISNAGMATDFAPEVDWISILNSQEEELRRLNTHSSAENVMRSDAQVARHLDTTIGDGQWMLPVNIDSCLRVILFRLLFGQRNASFDQAKFDSIYREVEDYFYGDTLKRRVIVPLTDFSMEVEEVPLEEGLSVARLLISEREEFASQTLMFPLPPFGTSGPTGWEEFALILRVEVPKVIGEPISRLPGVGLQEIATNKFEDLVSALRLFKGGGVGYNSIIFRSISWEPHGSGGSFFRPHTSVGPRYILSKDEIPAFKSFWMNYRRQRAQKHRRIDLALRRFNLAYERMLLEDRLIDYIIAMEALLLKEQDELAYRLSLRGSRLLGSDSEARHQIYTRLRTAYKLRSNIVHGDVVSGDVSLDQKRVTFAQFVDEIAEYVRSSIKKMLLLTESNNSEDDIIEVLDRQTVRGE